MQNQLNLFHETDLQRRINEVLNMGIHESIILRKIINEGSTTVRDLLPYMNYPCGPIRDLHDVYEITLYDVWETRQKKVFRKGKEVEVTERYKRYFLEKLEA